MYLHKLNVGDLELENNILLAPMAGITDLPFRIICEKYNPGLVYTEMVSSKAIFYDDQKTKQLLKTDGEKRPISMQIFGSDTESMAFAAKYVSELADIVDINMGCPAPKVTKNGDGSRLLLDLNKAKEIIEAVVTNSTKPVTLKIRKGWDQDNIVACDIAKIAEEAGVKMITVHGRTRTEFYSGKVDLNIIRKVKETVNIPVIGNGDIVDEDSALRMFEETGVDGIMIARGAMGNPWIFENIKYFLQTGKKIEEKSVEEKMNILIKHINLAIEEKGENIAIKEMRKHMACYTKNMPNSSIFRNNINCIDNKEELFNTINEYMSSIS